MADTPKHSVSVAGVVVDDQDRVLAIQRRDNQHWEPPGGVLELDERPEDGVRREVFEETGVSVTVGRVTGVYKNMRLSVIALVFRCSAVAGHPVSTDESKSVTWMSLEEARKLMRPAYYIRVADAFDAIVKVRNHDGVEVDSTTDDQDVASATL